MKTVFVEPKAKERKKMSIKGFGRVVAGIALALSLAGAAGAATMSVSSAMRYSGNFKEPTVIANGTETVSGIWSGRNDHQFLAFTGLQPGAQSLTVSFSPITPIGDRDYSFSAGGQIKWKTTPFAHSGWEGETLAKFSIEHRNRDDAFDFTLTFGDDFEGKLWLGLLNTHGTLKYTISAPGNAAAGSIIPPAPVPLPGAAPLMLLALGALGATAVARRRQSAPGVLSQDT